MLNTAPDIPEITGPPKGKTGNELEYKITTNDPDGDNVYYCINWGENTSDVCIGPILQVTKSQLHIFGEIRVLIQ